MDRYLLTRLQVVLRDIAQQKWQAMWWPLITNVWPESTTDEDKKAKIQQFFEDRKAVWATDWGFTIYP